MGFYLFKNTKDIVRSKKVITEEIQRIKFKLFHLDSMLVLRFATSSIEINSKLVLSKISFKGIFPFKVTMKTPNKYMRDIKAKSQKYF